MIWSTAGMATRLNKTCFNAKPEILAEEQLRPNIMAGVITCV